MGEKYNKGSKSSEETDSFLFKAQFYVDKKSQTYLDQHVHLA